MAKAGMGMAKCPNHLTKRHVDFPRLKDDNPFHHSHNYHPFLILKANIKRKYWLLRKRAPGQQVITILDAFISTKNKKEAWVQPQDASNKQAREE
jgi:hypothetical protein